MSSASPLVSIYIPTKNRPALLRRAVTSCLAQTYTQLEIIIVDDGSDPDHWQEVQQLAQLDSRITLLRNALSQGAPAARNKAIYAAAGRFITGLDDDDEFTPERVHTFVQHANLLDKYAAICSGYTVQQKAGRYNYAVTAKKISLNKLLYANYVGCQVFTLTSRLQDICGFAPNMVSCQDYDTWIRLALAYGPIYRLAQPSYIVHQEHELGRISQSKQVVEGYTVLLKKYRSLMSSRQQRCQQLNLAANQGNLTAKGMLWLPLSEQWRFLKILLRQKLNQIKKGTNS